MSRPTELLAELEAAGDPALAVFAQRFFKTGVGQYGEGDRFLGIRVPKIRSLAAKYIDLSIKDIDSLLNNNWHEVRLAAVVIMTLQYKSKPEDYQKKLYDLYLNQAGRGLNNWDLVDISCHKIVGAYLLDKDRQMLYDLAKGGLWQKRISIISTFCFLRNGDPVDTYKLAEILVGEKHDLMHKAVGWSLREMGKVDGSLLRQFLDKHAATMPRTMLRYAIEKMDSLERQHYMGLKNAG